MCQEKKTKHRCNYYSLSGNYTSDISSSRRPHSLARTGIPALTKPGLPAARDTGLPLLLGDDEHVVKEEEVDLLFGCPLGEKHRVLYVGCQLATLHQPPGRGDQRKRLKKEKEREKLSAQSQIKDSLRLPKVKC